MSTTTANIFIGHAHPNDSGIIPSHLIHLSESSRPAYILHSLDGKEEVKAIIPTLENMIDDLYMMIAVYILKELDPGKPMQTEDRSSLYDIFSKQERLDLYKKTKKIISKYHLKVVFNILDGSSLLYEIEKIKKYPNDFEVTVPFIKKEYDAWTQEVKFKEFKW